MRFKWQKILFVITVEVYVIHAKNVYFVFSFYKKIHVNVKRKNSQQELKIQNTNNKYINVLLLQIHLFQVITSIYLILIQNIVTIVTLKNHFLLPPVALVIANFND